MKSRSATSGSTSTAGGAAVETGSVSTELAAMLGRGEPRGRRKSCDISDSIASILAAVAIASVRASSRSGMAFSVVAKLGEAGVDVLFKDRFTGPDSGRASERLSCADGRAGGRAECDDECEPRLDVFFVSFGSFLKNEKTTRAIPASKSILKCHHPVQPRLQQPRTVKDKHGGDSARQGAAEG